MAFLRTLPVLAVSLAPMLACTFNAGGLGQTGEDSAGTGGVSSSSGGVTGSGTGGPTSEPPTTGEPSSAGPGGEMSATGSTGAVDPDTTATTSTTVDPSGSTGAPMTGSTSGTTTTGDESTGMGTTGCVEQDYFKDGDGDGYGDASMKKSECAPPKGYVEDATDCDDKKGDVNPGAPEKCGGGDNDCDEVVDEFDPDGNTDCGGCKMYLYQPNNRVYHFCGAVKFWSEAVTECDKRGAKLAKDIDMAHHDWLVGLLPNASGPWWLGATSPNADDKFVWTIDNSPVPQPDPRWSFTHPSFNGMDRMVLVSKGNADLWLNDNGKWYDREDKDHQPFICESAFMP